MMHLRGMMILLIVTALLSSMAIPALGMTLQNNDCAENQISAAEDIPEMLKKALASNETFVKRLHREETDMYSTVFENFDGRISIAQ